VVPVVTAAVPAVVIAVVVIIIIIVATVSRAVVPAGGLLRVVRRLAGSVAFVHLGGADLAGRDVSRRRWRRGRGLDHHHRRGRGRPARRPLELDGAGGARQGDKEGDRDDGACAHETSGFIEP
jgi:hypothetical protein